nr:hypothetical protein [Myxococcota bacterium]
MTIELRLPGVRQEAEPQAESDFDDLVRRTILSSHTVSPTRGALDSAVAEANPDDVLELHWEGDIVELVRVGDVESRYPQARRSDDGRLEIPTTRALSTARGSRFLNLKSIFHIRLDLKEALIEEATGAVVRYTVPKAIAALEERFQAKPGLFRVKADGDLEDEPVTGLRAQDGPILVMLHGTFSSHEGSFSDLFGAAGKAATQEWRDLHAAYPNRVLSLQHRTVSVSPASNLRDMVRRLPKGATVDLLSYSRGGIIGDLLSRHPWSEGDLDAFFEFPPYKEIRRDLTRLSSLLAQKELRVRRFVRVASPAAGTLLASERLDTYLNVILSLLAKLGGPGGEFVKLLATQIVSTRTKADLLPGLESMMPHKDRGFVPFLNQLPEDEGRDEALAVIAGDVRGGGLFDRIKDFFSHLYYREPNDFVVDSRSMFRGVPRTKSVGFYFRSPNATHFSYFGQAETRSRMAEWLIDQSEDRYVDLVHGQDYGGIRGAPRAVRKLKAVEDIRADARPGEALVYLLPGIMGTHLAIKEGADVDRYWINVARLLFGGMRKLHMDQQGVVPDGLLESYYGDLYDRLGRENTVIHFGFDWRKPIAESARLLRDSIQLDLDDQAHPNRPVRIIAHSMGGLVARTFVAENPRLWKRMTERGGRLIMMGTPNFGSYAPAQVFTQNHRLLKLVAGVTIGDLDELTELVRTFPGLVEMLPKRGDRDLLTPAAWEGFGSLRPGDAILDGARKFRERLDTTAIDPDHMVYVAGHSEETPASMERSGSEVRFRYTGRGDGTVPWDLGILPGVQTYYVDAGHDKIPGHTKSFDGFADLLSDGETSKLETQPPTVSRGGKEELFESRRSLDQEEIRYFPNEEDLVDAICDLPEEFDDEPEFPLDLRVVNGNVKEARHRVLVGHYTGDPIVHAEGVIDRRLGGRMSRDLQLDRYPGPLESARVYGAHDGFPGALVVGLGHPGHLRRTSLERSLTAAFLELAVSDLPAEDEPVRVIEVSSLLIGTYGGSRVSIEDSVSALVEAALEANARLENQHLADRVQIGRIEIVELYRDIATDAGHAIRRVAERKRGWVRAAPTIEVKEGARRSRPHSPYNTGWSRRLRIATTDTGLEFEATTDLARLLPLPRSIQWSHVDGMLEKAMSGDTEAPSTLFQYLMPIDLVEAAGDSPDTIVELDSQSARIPWELLDPPSERGFVVTRVRSMPTRTPSGASEPPSD